MSWDSKKYFSKCQVYWERASASERDSDQFLINVAFACEFVVRGTLCSVSPVLNASSDSESVLFAVGLTPRTPPKTISIKEALKRLHRILPEVPEGVIAKVEALIDARNRELHGDGAEIAQLQSKEVMPSVYYLIVKAVEKAEQDMDSILGRADAQQAIQVANAINKDRTQRVKGLIMACKERFFGLPKEEQERRKTAERKDILSAVYTSGHHMKREKCPACAADGSLIAIPVGRSSPMLRGDEIFEEVRVIPTKFECECCGLAIKGLDELMSAGFSHEYCTIDTVNPIEHFHIDPMDYVDAEEIAREYNRDMYEYQDE